MAKLKKKIGPLPLYAWILVVAAAALAYRYFFSGRSAAAKPATTDNLGADYTIPVSSGGGGSPNAGSEGGAIVYNPADALLGEIATEALQQTGSAIQSLSSLSAEGYAAIGDVAREGFSGIEGTAGEGFQAVSSISSSLASVASDAVNGLTAIARPPSQQVVATAQNIQQPPASTPPPAPVVAPQPAASTVIDPSALTYAQHALDLATSGEYNPQAIATLYRQGIPLNYVTG